MDKIYEVTRDDFARIKGLAAAFKVTDFACYDFAYTLSTPWLHETAEKWYADGRGDGDVTMLEKAAILEDLAIY
ncbi:hypothetical protein CLAFUW4_02882 [Fulvia fulva]|uniref:Uncharacterized protein n=1 Tax=Passalora fulva TaxID=5499 RepID=A0A9Q8L9H5_PASFU|nr:uncharacterized protein CLAFUR5_02870 [Fulvia fulva]KAK4630904.1 hypothetical protein CLAFUR4_02875 [Fulvia fulva]KAK4632532.1 hypothetical protein CLAFUR0_02878 [Fulvia fulva]UJO13241.1 hypothetical protein CLAFUR5_02870 [Fulvia fulva]WPV10706.1 hypothetical protein CLAFUW4_02882 [Fulvia fulva]WPV26575.1 hypothetical protein CLAFUW7_02879 [Fulvia fulva]